jgi:predicted O-linked N-acetylglucosamine transferase (SPINDLY family)
MTLHYLPSQRQPTVSPWTPNATHPARARRQERRERLGFIAYSLALAATAFLCGWMAAQ